MDKKQCLKEILDAIKELNLINIMIIKTNENLLANNFPDTSIKFIKELVNKYKNIPVNNYMKARVSNNLNLFLYKISLNIFFICLTSENENVILNNFKSLSEKFSHILYNLFKEPIPDSKIKKLRYIKHIVFSKISDLGPTPVAWTPKTLNEEEKFEIAAKSILVLSAGFDHGTSNKMNHTTSIIPFVNLNCTGLVYIFSIPSSQARGNFIDAAITVLVPTSYKKRLLSHLDLIEEEIKEITKKLAYDEHSTNLLELLRENLDQLMQEKQIVSQTQVVSNSFKQIMLDEIKKIQKKKPYSKIL